MLLEACTRRDTTPGSVVEERTALRRERRLTLAGSAEFRVRGVRDAGRERDGDRPRASDPFASWVKLKEKASRRDGHAMKDDD